MRTRIVHTDYQLSTLYELLHSTLCTQNTGMSLLETFCADQIRSHVRSIQEAAAAQRLHVPAHVAHTDICMVCGLHKILFEPPLIYCLLCGQKIKRGQVYYCTPTGGGETGEVKVRRGETGVRGTIRGARW